MDVQGLVLLGTLDRTEQVTYGDAHAKAGQPVPGFYRMVINIGQAWDGEQMTRTLTYNSSDFDGNPTRVAQQLSRIDPGVPVAVKVSAKAPRRQGSKYADLDATDVLVLSGGPISAAAAAA